MADDREVAFVDTFVDRIGAWVLHTESPRGGPGRIAAPSAEGSRTWGTFGEEDSEPDGT
jgi:hypothetical protein